MVRIKEKVYLSNEEVCKILGLELDPMVLFVFLVCNGISPRTRGKRKIFGLWDSEKILGLRNFLRKGE